MTAYGAEVLADTPSIWIRGDDSNPLLGYADSSGNARHLDTLILGAGSLLAIPTIIPGPKKLGMSFPTGFVSTSLSLRTTYTQAAPSVGTYEFWVRFASNPGAKVTLCSWSMQGSGGTGSTFYVSLDTAGKIAVDVYNGSSSTVTSTSALSTGVWHHVVVSVGAAGTKIRVDKSTVGTSGVTSVSSLATTGFWVHGQYNGANITAQNGAYDIAEIAWYPTQLTDTRTDAHYDATNDLVTISGSWG